MKKIMDSHWFYSFFVVFGAAITVWTFLNGSYNMASLNIMATLGWLFIWVTEKGRKDDVDK